MAIEVINGFPCKTCTDVENAKKFIDPAHPDAGPVNQGSSTQSVQRGPAVVLGGALAGVENTTAVKDAAVFRRYGPDARR